MSLEYISEFKASTLHRDTVSPKNKVTSQGCGCGQKSLRVFVPNGPLLYSVKYIFSWNHNGLTYK